MKTTFLLIQIISILSTGFIFGQEISKQKIIPVQEEYSHKLKIGNIKVFQPHSGAKELKHKDTTSIKEGNESRLSFIKDIVVIVASLTAIFSFLFVAFPARKNQQLQSIIKYFQQGDSDEERKARKIVYTSSPIDENSASKVCSFFHFWGLMVRKRLLPICVFESASGIQVLKLYNKLEKYIEIRQENNPLYSEHFIWLKNKIKRKYNHIL